MPSKSLLFVYGTLKRGLQNQHFMAGQRFVREAQTLPRYRLYHFGWHPGMVEVEDGVAVQGEIYEMDAEALTKLDEYEGHPEQFLRRPVLLQHFFEQVDAYFFNQAIPAGTAWADRWPFPD